MHSWASRATLDIIGVAGLGRDFNTLDNSNDELARTYDSILDPKKGSLILYFAVNMFLPPWFVQRLPWKMNQMVGEAAANLRVICRKLVAQKKVTMDEEKEVEGKNQVDILAVLMRSGAFTDDGLVDQLLTFLAAGYVVLLPHNADTPFHVSIRLC